MSWHPLDGNMIAADAHYGQGKTPEDGDKCQHCEGGYLEYAEDDETLACDDCGEVAK